VNTGIKVNTHKQERHTISNTITAQDLRNEFDSIAQEIIKEVKNYGGDESELTHQAADGHEWVIYYTRNVDLVHAVWHWDGQLFDEAEQMLEDFGVEVKSWRDHTTQLAFQIMLCGIYRSLSKFEEEAA